MEFRLRAVALYGDSPYRINRCYDQSRRQQDRDKLRAVANDVALVDVPELSPANATAATIARKVIAAAAQRIRSIAEDLE